MDPYNIKVGPAAAKEVRKLPKTNQSDVVKTLEKLSVNPRPSGVEKLSEDPRFWRIRCGDYRMVYWIDDGNHLVVVLIVRHRSKAYRNLDTLDARLVAATLGPLLTSTIVRT